jgi:phage recombination protein Bet
MQTQQQQSPPVKQQLPAPSRSDAIAEYTPVGGSEPIKLSVAIIRDLIAVPTRSGKQCDDKQALKFLMLCRSRGLNPFEGDAYLLGYDTQDGPQFSLITAHQAFLKRAELHPEYDGMDSGVIVQTQDGQVLDREGDFTFEGEIILGGWAVVYCKNRSHPMKRRLKLSTFSTGKSRWGKDPAGMIVKCAEADALRSTFPTKMGGMYVEEEVAPKTVQAEVSTPPAAGRISFRNGHSHAAPTVQPSVAAPTPELPSQAETAPTEEQLADQRQPEPEVETAEEHGRQVTDWRDNLIDQIARVEDRQALQSIGATMNGDREWAGEEAYNQVAAAYQARYRELEPQSVAANGGRQKRTI